MNDAAGKTASCLSITEKRPHKPGGCVGIFFQLFDWNRRFAKKKLFSRKLLPPARAKQASKKFGGDERMPKTKLHLIADENSGGFPNMKKTSSALEQKQEMRSPSLVARLMGLESMPTVGKDKPKKSTISSSCKDAQKNESVNGCIASYGDESNLKSRPQKIQKTGQFEKQDITRFGSEALHLKSVLSRSRKHHHHPPKLLSPVKSPRASTRSSRLIDAATRILEPGLQAASKAKCALSYSRPSYYVSHDEIMSPDLSKQSDYDASVGTPSPVQNSCRSCGNLLEDVVIPNVEERPFVYSSSPIEKVREVDCQQVEQNVTISAQENENRNTRSGSVFNSDNATSPLQVQSQWHLLKEEQASFALKQRTRAQTRMSLDKDRIPPKSKLTSLQSRRVSSAANGVSGGHKDFIALNRSLCSRTRPRSPSKAEICSSFDSERKSYNVQEEPFCQLRNPVRKRRTISVNAHVDSASSAGSNQGRQRNIKSDVVRGKGMGRIYIKGKAANNAGDCCRDTGNKESGVISFTFNSPMRHKSGIPSGAKEKKEELLRKVIEVNDRGSKELPWSGDALGALLEEKLKELTSHEDDEFTSVSTPPKRSTAMILQELISALTAEHPPSQNNKTRLKEGSVGFVHNSNHLSPGSVLEASFSNESCFSSSVDDSSGRRLNLDTTKCSQDQLHPTEPEEDLLDSASSSSKRRAGSNQIVNDLVNQISRLLCSLGLTGSKLIHAKDVILNAELLFGDLSQSYSRGSRDFLVSPFLLDELEILARAMWPNFNSLLGFKDRKEGDRLRGFLFDCLIECFDFKYGRYTNSGFKAWTRLPLRIKAEMLLREVGVEVIKWTHLAGMTPDELIECDMSFSLGKWIDFEIEEFETGAEIGLEVLQILVDEIVVDFCKDCRLVSF